MTMFVTGDRVGDANAQTGGSTHEAETAAAAEPGVRRSALGRPLFAPGVGGADPVDHAALDGERLGTVVRTVWERTVPGTWLMIEGRVEVLWDDELAATMVDLCDIFPVEVV